MARDSDRPFPLNEPVAQATGTRGSYCKTVTEAAFALCAFGITFHLKILIWSGGGGVESDLGNVEVGSLAGVPDTSAQGSHDPKTQPRSPKPQPNEAQNPQPLKL